MSKMPSVSELIRRFEAKHGYEPTAEELTDAWFSGELAELEGMR
jgi:hypothetical protein